MVNPLLPYIQNTEPHTSLIPDQSPDKAPAQTTHSNQQPSTPHPCTGELHAGQQNECVWKVSGVAEKRREAGQGTKRCIFSPSVTTSRCVIQLWCMISYYHVASVCLCVHCMNSGYYDGLR